MHRGTFMVLAAAVINSAVADEVFKVEYFVSASGIGRRDAYCIAFSSVGDGKYWNEDQRTNPKPGTDSPVWPDKFSVEHRVGEKTYLKIEVYDQLVTDSEFLGSQEFAVIDLIKKSNFQVTSASIVFETVKPLLDKGNSQRGSLKIHHRIAEITGSRAATTTAASSRNLSFPFNAFLVLVLSLNYFLWI